jgi:hypothetical protein
MADPPVARTNILNEAISTPKSLFRNAAGLLQRIASIAELCQELENVMHDVTMKFTLDGAEGWTLDVIGTWIGEPRLGLSDTDYKAFLRAVIRTRRSHGRVIDFYEVLEVLEERDWRVYDLYPMTWAVQADGAWGAISPEVVLRVLKLTRDSASEVSLCWHDAADANTLHCASGDSIEYVGADAGFGSDDGLTGGVMSEYAR